MLKVKLEEIFRNMFPENPWLVGTNKVIETHTQVLSKGRAHTFSHWGAAPGKPYWSIVDNHVS